MNKNLALELARCEYIDRKENLLALRRARLGFCVVDILDRQVELILMVFPLAAVFSASIGQNPQQRNLLCGFRGM